MNAALCLEDALEAHMPLPITTRDLSLDRVLQQLRVETGARCAVFLTTARVHGVARIVEVRTDGSPPAELAALQGKSLKELGWRAEAMMPQHKAVRCALSPDLSASGGLATRDGVIEGWLGWMTTEERAPRAREQMAFQRCQSQLHDVAGPMAGLSDAVILFDAEGRLLAGCDDLPPWLALAGMRRALASRARHIGSTGTSDTVEVLGQALLRIRVMRGPRPLYLVQVTALEPLLLSPLGRLSAAQLRVAAFAAVGATVPEIARSLGRSDNTIRTHLKSIYRRLEIASRLELAWHFEQVWSLS